MSEQLSRVESIAHKLKVGALGTLAVAAVTYGFHLYKEGRFDALIDSLGLNNPNNVEHNPMTPVQTEGSPEVDTKGLEKVDGWLNRSVVFAETWLGSGAIHEANRLKGKDGGKMTITNNPEKAAELDKRVNTSLSFSTKDAFTAEGISELVTYKELPGREEDLHILTYQTLSTGRKNAFKAQKLDGGYGNSFKMDLVLPGSDLKEILRLAKEDPEVIHQLVDRFMITQLGSQDRWEASRPPYEDWRKLEELTGGKSKIAFSSVQQARVSLSPATSQVIAY